MTEERAWGTLCRLEVVWSLTPLSLDWFFFSSSTGCYLISLFWSLVGFMISNRSAISYKSSNDALFSTILGLFWILRGESLLWLFAWLIFWSDGRNSPQPNCFLNMLLPSPRADFSILSLEETFEKSLCLLTNLELGEVVFGLKSGFFLSGVFEAVLVSTMVKSLNSSVRCIYLICFGSCLGWFFWRKEGTSRFFTCYDIYASPYYC